MKDRRRARTQRLQEAHNVELAHELRNQQLERDAAAKTSTEQLQKQLLGEALKGKGKQEVEDVMYALLRQRHITEAVHLRPAREGAVGALGRGSSGSCGGASGGTRKAADGLRPGSTMQLHKCMSYDVLIT